MPKSATDLMQEIITAAVLDAFMALKAASGGLPNAMARDLQAIHLNTAVADLPAEVQKAIGDATRDAFSRLLREGYAVAPSNGQPMMPPRTGPKPPPRPRPTGGAPVVETRRPRTPRPGGGSGGPPRGPKR